MVSDLSEGAIQAALTTRWLARPYHYLATTGSTNDVLRQMVAAGSSDNPPAGTLVLADFQSRGKGRLNRRWEAPPRTSLLFSLLFRPDGPAEQAAWLTMMGSLAAAVAIEAVTPLTVGLKWPNDLVIWRQPEWRKVGGLLLEGNFNENGRVDDVILGIGINVNIPAGQLPPAVTPATSLLVATGQPVDRRRLLIRLLQELETLLDTAVSPHAAWQARLINLGQPVRVTALTPALQPPLTGIAEGADEWGRLLVRDVDGVLQAIAAGDVTLRP
jgi:BirA family transcriptional regulator, biotin operon repressor / biotin---[acetyl-CoA-carboxylase] ligase